MSQETAVWLNQNTLIGFTDKRGQAWHYRASDQGDEPNHYAGAIPVEDVQRRLFHWTPVEGTIATTYLTEDGVTTITDPERKAIIRPDTQAVLGVFKQGFRIHNYSEWLIKNVETLLDDDLSIGSAGLLRGGAVAWVQVEVPENITTPEGVEFRPFLSAATSLDGSLASTYQTGAQIIVCDNTLSAALGEASALRVKVRHSVNSLGRIGDVRDALGLVYQVADDFAAQVKALCETPVNDKQFTQVLDLSVPTEGKEGRGLTLAQTKRDALTRLWRSDERVVQWNGTAFGVLQAFNTYTHHFQSVKGAERAERNALRAVTGEIHRTDAEVLTNINKVLASA